MHYLYGSKLEGQLKLVATFDSEEQLLAYVRWATLKTNPNGGANSSKGVSLLADMIAGITVPPL